MAAAKRENDRNEKSCLVGAESQTVAVVRAPAHVGTAETPALAIECARQGIFARQFVPTS